MSRHPAEIHWPESVAAGRIILPKPEETSRQLLALRREEREFWKSKRLAGGGRKRERPVDPVIAREIELAREWVNSGPHAYGTMKRFCFEKNLNYTTFHHRVMYEVARVKAEASKK